MSAVSIKYAVPRSTLQAKRDGKYSDKKPGPAAVLCPKEEKELVEWIITSSRKGFPITKIQLIESVRVICVNLKKKNTFRNNTPGRSWIKGFMKKNPEITPRVSENFCLNREKVSELSLRNWFNEIKEYLTTENLLNIEAECVFNCDETGIHYLLDNFKIFTCR